MATAEARPGQSILSQVQAWLDRLTSGGSKQDVKPTTGEPPKERVEPLARPGGKEGKDEPVRATAPPEPIQLVEQTAKPEKAIPSEVTQIKDPATKLEKMSDFVEDPKLKGLLHATASVMKEGTSKGKIEKLMDKYNQFKSEFGYVEEGDVFKAGNVLAQVIWEEAQGLGYTSEELQKIEKILVPDLGSGLMPLMEGGFTEAEEETLKRIENISSYQLNPKELLRLVRDPSEWFHAEWDTIDNIEGGPEDQGASALMSRLGIALSTMDKIQGDLLSNEKKEQARKINDTRMGLYLMRHVLLNKDLDNARHIATRLGMSGLFYSRGMVNGGVSVAVNKLAEHVERERINRGNTVPAMAIHSAQKDTHRTLLDEALRGVYGDQFGTTHEEIEKNVRRSVLIGYNWFIASEQMAVHVARGDIEAGSKQIVNEPFEFLASLFKMWEFSSYKYETLSPAQLAIVNKTFSFLGDGDIELGKKRFDRMIGVNDLFSSGWRIEPIVDTIRLRIGEEEGKYFALGMQIQTIKDKAKKDGKDNPEGIKNLKDTWGRVAEVRPLEIAKLLKEQAMDKKKIELFRGKSVGDQLKLQAEKPWRKEEDPLLQKFLNEHQNLFKDIHTHSELEQILNKYLTPLYADMVHRRPRKHIDFAHLTDDQKHIVRTLGGDSDLLSAQMVALSGYAAKEEQINRIMKNMEFYNRTLFVDDVPFEMLEEVGKLPNKETIEAPLSRYYTIGGAQEPYPRIFNDTYAALQASKAISSFITTHDLKQLQALVEAKEAYQSPGEAAKAIHQLASAYFSLAKTDTALAWLSLDKLPIQSSELQRLFGRKAESIDPAEMRKMVDEVNIILGKFPELEDKFKEIAGTSDIALIFFMARWDIILVLAILMKEMFEQATGKN